MLIKPELLEWILVITIGSGEVLFKQAGHTPLMASIFQCHLDTQETTPVHVESSIVASNFKSGCCFLLTYREVLFYLFIEPEGFSLTPWFVSLSKQLLFFQGHGPPIKLTLQVSVA